MSAAVTLAGGGLTARVLTLGAIVQDLRMEGVAHPLVLGSPDPADYAGPLRYAGAIVGRFANRIAGARFALDGVEFRTDANEGGRTTLHGGAEGTDRMVWRLAARRADAALLRLDLPAGHMGFPGRLRIALRLALPGDGVLAFDLRATTDAPTVCNLAHHGYFNLTGAADVLSHRLRIDADRYLPTDLRLIPTDPAPVVGTRFDFRQPRPVAAGEGLDHNFCLNPAPGLRPVAWLAGGGLTLTVATDQPGLQVYDGAHFDGAPGLEGRCYGPHAGIALETQVWPDAPNRPDFPPARLDPGRLYRHRVRYRFARSRHAPDRPTGA